MGQYWILSCRPFLVGGGQTDKSLSALGAERAFQEIQLSACSGELAASGRLGIFLSHQIQLYASVNTDDVFIRLIRSGE